MEEETKQAIWRLRNEVVECCDRTIKDLARQDYENAVGDISEIKATAEAFYKENAN